MADTTDGIFTNGDGGIYTGTTYGTDEQDFESWTDWKKIKAAITGAAAVATDDATRGDNANGLVDPDSLRRAGNAFNQTQLSVATVAENLRQQARGLAGEGRPWQGKAADAFLAKMETLSEYLDAQAERINGGDTTLGSHSVPNQLYQSGNRLQWAQNAVNYIDSFYANWASQHGAHTYDGLVHVSEIKGLPEKMAEEMKAIMRQLAAQYKVNVDSVQNPSPSDFGGPSEFPSSSFPSLSTPDMSVPPVPSTSLPSTSLPDTSLPSSSLPDNSFPSASIPTASIPGSDVPPPSADVPPPNAFGGPTSTDIPNLTNSNPPGGGNIPDLTGGDGGLPGGANGLPGFDSTGPGAIPNLTGLTNLNPDQQKSELPTPSIPSAGTGGLPDGTLPDGTTLPAGSTLPDGSTIPDVSPPTSDSLGNQNGLGGGIPPISPMQPPQSNNGGLPDKSDASGLLGGDNTPWQPGDIPGSGVPAAPTGTLPGGVGGSAPPMMPMQPPQSNNGGVPDQSDASGLLGGDTAPWQPGDIPGSGMPDAPTGTLPGGADGGLEIPSAGSPLPGGVAGGAPPMMPMQPPQSNNGGLPDQSDASGLLGGNTDPWQPGDIPGVPDAPTGTLPGGAGGSTPPLMPMQPPQSNNNGLPDQSDASGLVSDGTDPWTSPDLPGSGIPDAPQGTNPGQDELRADGWQPSTGTTMPPFAPMSPPQTANGGQPERSDASGLVQADDGQWYDPTPVDGPDAPDGAPPMLSLPRADEPDQPRRSDASQLIEPEEQLIEPEEELIGPEEQPGTPETPVDEPAQPEAPPPPVAGDDHRREVPDIVPPFLAFGFPGGRPGERDRPQRSKAGEALEEDSPWAPEGVEPPTDQGDEMPDDDESFDDRVPVVRTEDSDDDFASWDSEMLPWGGGGDSGAEPSDDGPEAWGSLEWQDEPADETPDADVPVSPAFAAWRPSRVTAESRAAALAADRPLMSGGPELTEGELQKLWEERDEQTRQRELERRRAAGELVDEDEADEDEAKADEAKDDRQAVNLLHQDDQAWGGNAADSGVIG